MCVFLFGGNDAFNMVVPATGQAYTDYANSRQNLSIPQGSLLSMGATGYGFHPGCPELQALFNSSRLGVIANTGMLIEPTDQNQFLYKLVQLPSNLFSHNSQTGHWQSLDPNDALGTTDGWGGRMTEDIALIEPTEISNYSQISINGTNDFQRGTTGLPYNVGRNGVTLFSGLNTNNARNTRRLQAFNELLDQRIAPAGGHLMEQAYAQVMRDSFVNSVAISNALGAQTPLTTVFPTSRVGSQLEMVANLLGPNVQTVTNINRQVFFVGMGGFDTHGSQLVNHAGLMTDLSQSLNAFNSAMIELGLEDNVTLFTNSEFGRTLTSNGDGTDHGWGGHQLVMGGSVNGGVIHGTMPTFVIGGPDDTRSGRLIPTTSSEQYAATLAQWFGIQDVGAVPNPLDAIFPNLANFDNVAGGPGRSVPFMATV